jgi:hypothetical protein
VRRRLLSSAELVEEGGHLKWEARAGHILLVVAAVSHQREEEVVGCPRRVVVVDSPKAEAVGSLLASWCQRCV